MTDPGRSTSAAQPESSAQAQQAAPEALRASPPSQLPIRPGSRVGRAAEPLNVPGFDAPTLPTEVGAGRLDPFEMRPVSEASAPSIDSLMSHCEYFLHPSLNSWFVTALDAELP